MQIFVCNGIRLYIRSRVCLKLYSIEINHPWHECYHNPQVNKARRSNKQKQHAKGDGTYCVAIIVHCHLDSLSLGGIALCTKTFFAIVIEASSTWSWLRNTLAVITLDTLTSTPFTCRFPRNDAATMEAPPAASTAHTGSAFVVIVTWLRAKWQSSTHLCGKDVVISKDCSLMCLKSHCGGGISPVMHRRML